MSLLSQFFGGGGGSPSSQIESRVLIVDGGQGNAGALLSGTGGRVYELNVVLTPGSTCPVTVGAGGTNSARAVCNQTFSPYGCPCPITVVFTAGNFGGLSSFGTLISSCLLPNTSTPLNRCYLPESNSDALCSNIDIKKQSLPLESYIPLACKSNVLEQCCSARSATYGIYTYNCSGGYFDSPVITGLDNGAVISDAIRSSKRCLKCTSPYVVCQILNPTCYSVHPAIVQSNYATGVGYVSDITGCVCVYGAGGINTWCRTPTPYTCGCCAPSTYLCRCDVTYTGSGAGAPVLPTICGCPGIVVVQYPTDYQTATTSSPNVCDCSPLTPGYRTYKFYCPGSITLP